MTEKVCSSKAPESEALGGFCREDYLLEELGLKKSTLNALRQRKGFPFISITKTERIYYLPHVREWLLNKQRNKARAVSVGGDNPTESSAE